jgi:hypothetical protein
MKHDNLKTFDCNFDFLTILFVFFSFVFSLSLESPSTKAEANIVGKAALIFDRKIIRFPKILILVQSKIIVSAADTKRYRLTQRYPLVQPHA